MKTLTFKNFSEEDFSHSFDSIPYNFPAGGSIVLEDFKAIHFANHLIDRELNRKNIPVDNILERQALEREAILSVETKEEVVVELKEIKSKAKKGKKVELEKEFEDPK